MKHCGAFSCSVFQWKLNNALPFF